MDEEENKEIENQDEEYHVMTKAEFLIRLLLWIAIAVAAPIIFIDARFGLFTEREAGKGLTGWGVFAIAFLAVMLFIIIRQTKKGLRYASMGRQILDGITTLIPFVAFIFLLQWSKTRIQQLEEFMIFMVICEGVAVPINPMRKWGEQNDIKFMKVPLSQSIRNAIRSIFGKKEK